MKNPDSNIKYHIAEIINLGPQAQYFTRGRAQVYPSTQLGEAKLEPGFLGSKWVQRGYEETCITCITLGRFLHFVHCGCIIQFFVKSE